MLQAFALFADADSYATQAANKRLSCVLALSGRVLTAFVRAAAAVAQPVKSSGQRTHVQGLVLALKVLWPTCRVPHQPALFTAHAAHFSVSAERQD